MRETTPSGTAGFQGCTACGLGQDQPLWRETLPVWGTFAALCVIVLPLFFWQLHREGHI
jgi:hypothetical protein